MVNDYPYMISNNKIQHIIEALHKAAKPQKFSHEFLKQIGFNSSNDRAVIPLFKRLGFISENGSPTNYYDDLKDKTRQKVAMGERVRDLYAELFAINSKINSSGDEEIKGAISRVTGKDASAVTRYFNTFKALCNLSNFDHTYEDMPPKILNAIVEDSDSKTSTANPIKSSFHYNIQIHLPATTEISVYNAIFKSLHENLLK